MDLSIDNNIPSSPTQSPTPPQLVGRRNHSFPRGPLALTTYTACTHDQRLVPALSPARSLLSSEPTVKSIQGGEGEKEGARREGGREKEAFLPPPSTLLPRRF